MWWLIIIIGFILAIIINKFTDYRMGIIVFLIPFVSIFWLFIIATSSLNQEVVGEYEVKQYNIQGLESNITINQNIKGSFILGFGSIKSESEEIIKYYYFKVDDTGKKLESIEVSEYSDVDVYIRETNDIEPCLIYRYKKTKLKNIGIFKWLFGEFEGVYKDAEILVVPENTTKIEYNVGINTNNF